MYNIINVIKKDKELMNHIYNQDTGSYHLDYIMMLMNDDNMETESITDLEDQLYIADRYDIENAPMKNNILLKLINRHEKIVNPLFDRDGRILNDELSDSSDELSDEPSDSSDELSDELSDEIEPWNIEGYEKREELVDDSSDELDDSSNDLNNSSNDSNDELDNSSDEYVDKLNDGLDPPQFNRIIIASLFFLLIRLFMDNMNNYC